MNYKHGDARKGKVTKLHGIWRDVLKRCYSVNTKAYQFYGARGITVCSKWKQSYEVFRDWALSHGYAPGLCIERKNNNQGYNPKNCTFVDRKQQARNRRTSRMIKVGRKTQCLAAWAEELGITYYQAKYRINKYGNFQQPK